MKRWLRFGLLMFSAGLAGTVHAQTCTNTAGGDWSNTAIWTCAAPAGPRVPTNADNVTIITNTTVTINNPGAVAGQLTINGGATQTSVNMGGTGTLTVTNAGGRTGNIIINAPTANVTKQLAVGARTLTTTGNVTISGGTAGGGAANISQLSVTTGSASIGGNLIINAGTVNTNVARATVTTGTIAVTGNATLTGGGTNSRDALISVTGVSATTGVTVGGTLNINATVAGSSSVTLGVAGSSMRVTGAVTNNDTLTVGTGTFTAQSTLSTGSAASAIAATTSVTTGTLNVTGNATVTSGTNGLKTMTVGNGTIAIGGALDVTAALSGNDAGDATASVTGTGTMNITGNVTVTGGTTALRDALLTVSGVSGVGAGVNIGGSLTVNAATLAGSSTVSLTNASSRMRVTGAGGVINNDSLLVDPGIFSMTNAAATLTTGSGAAALAATTRVTTGSMTVAGSAVVDSRTNGLKTLTVGNGTISIGGDLSVTAAAATLDTGDATASVTGTGTMNITGNVTVTGGSNANRDASLTVTGASGVGAGVNIGGSLTVNAATVAGSSTVSLTNASSRMTVTGTGGVINNDTLTVGVGIFSMTNAAATLTTGSGAAALAATTSVTTGSLTVAGNVVVDSRTNGLKTLSLTNGTINITGNLSVTAAAATADTGDATASVTGTGTMNIGGNATVTGGSNANRDALLTVTGASGVGAGINISGTLNVNATIANSSTVSLTNASSRITVSGAGGVNNGGTVAVGVGIFSVSNAAATYTNSNAAIVAATSVSTGSLTVAGAFSNATGETVTVSGVGSLTAGGTYTNTGTTTISTTGIINANGGFSNTGTFTNSAAGQLFLRGVTNTIDGTFTRGTGTVTMNGSVNQNLSGTALFPPTTAGDGFYNFTVNNAAGVTLGSNVVVRNVITFTTGEVTTGANVLISELTCATSVTRTSGHVIGNFQKFIPAGASTCVFQVGSTGAYAQASLVFNGVAVGGGRLIVRTDTPDHPSIGSSGLNSALSVNRYWTLTLTGVTGTVLPAFTNYGATFTFVNPGDLDVGVTTGNFEIRRFSAAVWNNTTVGARTGTTTQATGILALGEFAIGEVAPPTPGSFNAFETTTGAGAITGVIRTKRAGVAFSLDVVAILSGAQQASFTNTVRVDLLGNNTLGVALDGSNCPTSFTVVQTVGTDPTITAGRSTVNFAAVPNSWRDVRVRIRFPTGSPTVTSCSTDNFAIRPDAITGFSASHNDRTTAGTATSINSTAFGALVHNAGRPFSFRANAVNGAGSPAITTNYTGAPLATVTACGPGVGFEACTLTQGALSVTTTFAAGALSTDTAQYSEVGSFGLQLIDDDFASVDASDGSTLGERRIASSVINVGRFVPDNFAVAFNVPVFAPACTGFTYQGQLFNYSIAPVITLTAREAGGATTALYAGNWWRLTASTLTPVTQAARYTAASGTLNLGNLPAVTADPAVRYNGDALPSPPVAGTGTLTFSSGTGLSFTRNNAAPSAEFDAEIALSVNVIDADNVTYASNPAAFGAASAGNGIQFGNGSAGTKRVRYGRLRMGSASGSQLLAMRIPVEAQYWNGSVFVTNILDSCTTLLATNVGLGNFGGSLNTGETTASIVNSPLQSGRSAIRLSAPGAANAGSVDVTLNLGPTGDTNADACAGFAPTAVAGNLAHLRGLWCNPPNTYSKDPSVRARFGINRGSDQSIYRREQ
jgi:hypothetical protein